VAANPLLIAGGAALLFTLRPRRIFKWISRGLLVASVGRRVLGFVASRRSR
jgi:hypothetical protein